MPLPWWDVEELLDDPTLENDDLWCGASGRIACALRVDLK